MTAATPRERYAQALQQPGFVADPAQQAAIEHLQRVYVDLLRVHATRNRSWWARLTRRRQAVERAPVKGLYFWGGVGRGKTMLVDMFYESLPFADRERTHFHRFMRAMHEELHRLRDAPDPVRIVANRMADRARVVCLDEFHVADITDAMLLGRVLEALFARNVALVATSNEAPGQLYRGGLQRERFVPAIALIERHMEVVSVDGDTDHRLRALERAEIYHTPLDTEADASLARSFDALTPEPGAANAILELDGRDLRTVRLADGVAWFDFDVLCGGQRSARDYIELARCYQTVLLGNVPVMDVRDDERARRFVHLIDELYDRNVKLVVSAATAPDGLYRGERLAAMFRRTTSRLIEMQSHDYLARPHLSA